MLWLLAALQIWVADESDKVRPDARPPAVAQAPRIRLAAAGGECVGAQVVIRGPALGLTAVARGKPQLDLYRVGTIFLEHPSGPERHLGQARSSGSLTHQRGLLVSSDPRDRRRSRQGLRLADDT